MTFQTFRCGNEGWKMVDLLVEVSSTMKVLSNDEGQSSRKLNSSRTSGILMLVEEV